jgi:sulfur carrier protein
MNEAFVIANGRHITAPLPCSIEHFLLLQKLPARRVVVEHNGQAVAPSEFKGRQLAHGDRLEIVQIVAGG